MRRSPDILLRPLLLAVAATLLIATGAQLARAADAPPAGAPPTDKVTIKPSRGGAPRELALSQLATQPDVQGRTYMLRAADRSTTTFPVAGGFSLEALLREAGLDGDPFTYVELYRADGSTVIVPRDRLAGGAEGPPVVWADAQGVHFLRPADDEGDPNGADLLAVTDGALPLVLRTGEALAVRISASTLRAMPNEAIDFSASLATGELGPGMSFSWYFDDEKSAVEGASVTRRFHESRDYNVILTVMRGGVRTDAQAFLTVRIGRPEEERAPRGHTTGDRRRRPSGGEEAGAGSDAGAGGGTGGTGGGTGGTAPTAPSAPTAPVTTPPEPPQRRTPPRARTPAAPRGTVVSGTLLASADAGPVLAAGAPAAAAGDRQDPLHVPPAVWAALGLLAVVALGWVLESRHTLPFWQP